MNERDTLNVTLLALTGFGNPVLKALISDSRVKVGTVFTVKYANPFPYYEERQLAELCYDWHVPCIFGVNVGSDEGIALLRKHSPDLIIVATFKQILMGNVLSLPRLGVVNLHASLLPRYRGPCPSNAALLNDERFTGVTAHYVTEMVDEGNILLQRSVAIDAAENDGHLRQKLAHLAGEMTPQLVGMFTDFTIPSGVPQDHSLASFAPKPTLEDGYLELAGDIDTIRRKMRAFNPMPGTSILFKGNRIAVNRFELFQDDRPDGLYGNDNTIDFVMDSQTIKLLKNID